MRIVAPIKARLEEMGISPQKKFGQNFLINQGVIAKILAALPAEVGELIEIGPGLGALTEPLVTKGFTPRLIELDPALVEYWRAREFNVIAEDALQVDWEALNLKSKSVLISNLPYEIATHLVVDRCFGPTELTTMILMMQKEVAARLQARPSTKEYGFISVMAQQHFEIRKVADASPGDFFPAPKVAGRVLRFDRRANNANLKASREFLRFVKQAFHLRRKFLVNNLRGLLSPAQLEKLPAQLEVLGFTAKVRAEELSPAQFASLWNSVYGR